MYGSVSLDAEKDNPYALSKNLMLFPVIASFDTKGRIVPLYVSL